LDMMSKSLKHYPKPPEPEEKGQAK
jgi:hypothetical protein